MSKEAMKLALEALEDVQYYGWGQTERDYDARTAAITALREALAQPDASVTSGGSAEMQPVLTPKERRDAGQWHCPECFTFGHQHRQGCTAAHGIKE